MRRPLIAALVVVALVAGCGDDEEPASTSGTPLDDVEVTGEPGEKPTLDFEQPLEMTETAARVLEEGDGDEIETGSFVTFDYLVVNGRDGKELDTSYDEEPRDLVYEDSLLPGVHKGLAGVPAGSQVLVGIAPEDGFGADPTQDLLETDTLLFVAEIIDVRPGRAEGEAVEPEAGLPTVELAEDGTPTITVPETAPPTELVVQPLIEGEGPEVEAGQSITVHYTGVTWDTGEVFDSSWDGGPAQGPEPATFDIGAGAVIPGWDEGLVGQTVGSQVLLVIPPDKGYGDSGSGEQIPPGATLVFVVDILDAS
jgi:peptidylprolyl isomerase